MSDQPRNVPAWSDDRDRTSEMPTAAHGHIGSDRTDQFERSPRQTDQPAGGPSAGHRPDPYAGAPAHGSHSQHRPAPVGQPYRVGQEPVPTAPAAGPGVVRRYTAFPTALTAAVASALVALGCSFVANAVSPPLSSWPNLAWATTNLPGTNPKSGMRMEDIALAAGVLGVVVGLLVLLTALGAKWSAARGLVFLATWGACFIGGVLASNAVMMVQGPSVRAGMVYGAVGQGALWAIVFGWIAGLVAALVRPGRRVM